MKTINLILLVVLVLITTFSNAQHLKKAGTPDMRYKENKATYGVHTTSKSNGVTNPDIQSQDGYVKTDGTYVKPHFKTKTNDTNTDNFSTKGNANVYTRKGGTKAKDYSNDAWNYGKGKSVQTGSKGGQYYFNNKGNKTYVPKKY